MSKRYLRLDIEYEFNGSRLYMAKDNITRILEEDMPYCKIIFSRDTSIRENLNEPYYTKINQQTSNTKNP